MFDAVAEQQEAKRLLAAAVAEGPAHAYLFHGPAGVGKRRLALAFAGELLGDAGRTERRSHPDLYVLEPLGDQIRINAVREMRRDQTSAPKYLRGSGLPMPPNGSRMTASTKLRMRRAVRRSVSTQ